MTTFCATNQCIRWNQFCEIRRKEIKAKKVEVDQVKKAKGTKEDKQNISLFVILHKMFN